MNSLPPDRRSPVSALSEITRLARYLAPYRGRVTIAAIALVTASTTMLALGQGLRWLVDAGLAAGHPQLLDRALLVILGIVVLLSLATAVRYYQVTWIGERVAADLRKAVFNHLLTMEPGFFETQKTGELLSRLSADTTLLQSAIATSLSIALRNLLLLIGGTTLLAITSPKLTALVTLCIPLVIGPIVIYGRRVRRLSRATQDRVGDVGAYADEIFHGIRTVQSFGHETIDRDNFGNRVEGSFSTALSRIATRAKLTAIIIFLVFGAIGLILWVGGHDMLAGRISAGDLSAFVFYAVLVAGSVGAIAEVIGELHQAAGATERLLELLASKPAITEPADPVALPTEQRGDVAFKAVTFCYPGRDNHPALNQFTLNINAGETVALVGPSGAGKSTVFNLLLRFYDPASGELTLDDIALSRIALSDLRKRIAIVSQEPTLFATSVLENIRYGDPDADEAAIYAAAEAAFATEFIEKLPDRYETVLGERGARLSGGQKQRIAIARAVLRDPELLLLDEATSALDTQSELAVQKALQGLMQNRTTLVIAHRLSTVVHAERIVVMEDGQIVAEGDHQTLMREGGLYARLAELQFDHPEAAL